MKSTALLPFLVVLACSCGAAIEQPNTADAGGSHDVGPIPGRDSGDLGLDAGAATDAGRLDDAEASLDGAAPQDAGGAAQDGGPLADGTIVDDDGSTVDAADAGAGADAGALSDTGLLADAASAPDGGPIRDYLGLSGAGETWEAPLTVPGGWPYSSTPCQPGTWNGWANEGWLYCTGHDWTGVGLAAQAARDGARGLRLANPGSQRESGDIGKDLDTPVPPGAPVWISLWVRFSPDWLAFNTPTTREPYAHFLFLNSAQSQTGPRVNLLARVPYSSPPACEASQQQPPRPYMFFNFQTDDHDWSEGSYPSGCYNLLDHLGTWLYVQFKLQYQVGSGDPGQGQVEIWVDNRLIYSSTERWVRGEKGFSYLLLSDFFSDRAGATFDAVIDLDDLRATDVRPPMPR